MHDSSLEFRWEDTILRVVLRVGVYRFVRGAQGREVLRVPQGKEVQCGSLRCRQRQNQTTRHDELEEL